MPKPIADKKMVSDLAFVIYSAAKKKGDDMESPTDCAKAALEFLGYEVAA